MIDDDRPTIIINISDGVTQTHLAEVLYGIEEEGIPYTLQSVSHMSAAQAAHRAAIQSRLGLGVGASAGLVAVTTEKLAEDQPYISQNLNATRELDRAIGSNAARLVKRIPLRDMSTT